jgi:hypothetical protein
MRLLLCAARQGQLQTSRCSEWLSAALLQLILFW